MSEREEEDTFHESKSLSSQDIWTKDSSRSKGEDLKHRSSHRNNQGKSSHRSKHRDSTPSKSPHRNRNKDHNRSHTIKDQNGSDGKPRSDKPHSTSASTETGLEESIGGTDSAESGRMAEKAREDHEAKERGRRNNSGKTPVQGAQSSDQQRNPLHYAKALAEKKEKRAVRATRPGAENVSSTGDNNGEFLKVKRAVKAARPGAENVSSTGDNNGEFLKVRRTVKAARPGAENVSSTGDSSDRTRAFLTKMQLMESKCSSDEEDVANRQEEETQGGKQRRAVKAARPGAENVSRTGDGSDRSKLYRSKIQEMESTYFCDQEDVANRQEEETQGGSEDCLHEGSSKLELSGVASNPLLLPKTQDPLDTQPPTLEAIAVDEEANTKMVRQQVQEAITNMMTGHQQAKPEIDVGMDSNVEGLFNERGQQPRSICRKRMLCLLAIFLIAIIGGVAAYMILADPFDEGSASMAPSDQISESPTVSPTGAPTMQYGPPSKEDCEAIRKGQLLDGQDELEVLFFDVFVNMTLDEEGNFTDAMAKLIPQVQQEVLPNLAGCTDDSTRRRSLGHTREDTQSHRRQSRELEVTQYLIANAIVSHVNGNDETCDDTVVEDCRVVTLTLQVFVEDKATDLNFLARAANLIVQTFFDLSQSLGDRLDLVEDGVLDIKFSTIKIRSQIEP